MTTFRQIVRHACYRVIGTSVIEILFSKGQDFDRRKLCDAVSATQAQKIADALNSEANRSLSFIDGIDAFRSGRSKKSNPHPPGSCAAQCWLDGFVKAGIWVSKKSDPSSAIAAENFQLSARPQLEHQSP